jgi:preprotein translocase subunit Sss1
MANLVSKLIWFILERKEPSKEEYCRVFLKKMKEPRKKEYCSIILQEKERAEW